MKGICKDEQTMMKEDRKSGERYEKRWKKVENRNILYGIIPGNFGPAGPGPPV
jgi:hypothetical protein